MPRLTEWVVTAIDRRRRPEADQLFLMIPSVANHHADSVLQAQATGERRMVDKHLRRYHRTAPRDILVGAAVDGHLIGACLATAHFSQAATVLSAGGWPPRDPDPLWVYAYVRRALNIEALAVAPEYRTRGVGRALLADVEARAAADPDRDLRSLTAFASDAAAVALFAASGYTVGAARAPVPAEFIEGVVTGWVDGVMGDHPHGRNVYKRHVA